MLYNEKELFSLIAEGDETAFKQLYIALQPYLVGFIIKILKSEDAVMEVIQESLVRFWLNRDKLPEIRYPRSWLFKIVSNECYRYLRKHGLQQRQLEDLHNADAGGGVNTTDLELSFRETQRLIQQSVVTLSPRQREIFLLSREKGLRIPEIAVELGLSAKYVKKTLMLALRTIRRRLVDAGKFTLALLAFLFFFYAMGT